MDHEFNMLPDNEFSPELPVQSPSDGQENTIPTGEKDLLDSLHSSLETPDEDVPAPIAVGEASRDVCTPAEPETTCPQQDTVGNAPNFREAQPGKDPFYDKGTTPYFNYLRDPGRTSNAPYGASAPQNNGTARTMETPYGRPCNSGQTPLNPYWRGYYGAPPCGNPNPPAPNRFYGNTAPYGTYPLPVKKQKKNRKPVTAMIMGLIALLALNYYPLVAFVLGLLALCKAFRGIRAEGTCGGKKFCGILGMILGIFTLAISSSMLVMLLTLTVKVLGKGLF